MGEIRKLSTRVHIDDPVLSPLFTITGHALKVFCFLTLSGLVIFVPKATKDAPTSCSEKSFVIA